MQRLNLFDVISSCAKLLSDGLNLRIQRPMIESLPRYVHIIDSMLILRSDKNLVQYENDEFLIKSELIDDRWQWKVSSKSNSELFAFDSDLDFAIIEFERKIFDERKLERMSNDQTNDETIGWVQRKYENFPKTDLTVGKWMLKGGESKWVEWDIYWDDVNCEHESNSPNWIPTHFLLKPPPPNPFI